MASTGGEAKSAAEAVARQSYGKLIAFLAGRTRNVAAAEDALSEAFASALSDWPVKGIPDKPEAWLLTAARRKLIDAARRRQTGENARGEVQLLAEELGEEKDLSIPDQRLALMFACAHPAIDQAIRAPLMLQTVLGLDAARIASAFLVSPAAMGQRLARAKAKIREAGIAFAIPERSELAPRLDAVLEAIYAAFAEGWSDARGTDIVKRDLTSESLYLGGLVAQLLPGEAEALGLVALMLHAEARRSARRDAEGRFVPLAEQDSALWDTAMIERAEALLARAGTMGAIGRFQLEAALQSAHVHRCRTGENNWPAVLALYDALLALSDSPVVALNRALALAEVEGPAAALEALDALAGDARLNSYQPYWAARAALLARTDLIEEARHAYDVAIGLERDEAVRRFLRERQAALGSTK